MKVKKLIKEILYLIILFAVSALLIFTNIYGIANTAVFSATALFGFVALVNGFSLIALKKKNIFCSVANLICALIFSYPLFLKARDGFSQLSAPITILLLIVFFLPTILNFLFVIISSLAKNKGNSNGKLKARKFLSVITIIFTCVFVVLTVIYAVKSNTQISDNVQECKDNYSAQIDLANEMVQEYTTSDLIIEEVIDNHQLTYSTPKDNIYTIEQLGNVTITINTNTNTEEDSLANSIIVSDENVGIRIPKIYSHNFYTGESQTISIK